MSSLPPIFLPPKAATKDFAIAMLTIALLRLKHMRDNEMAHSRGAISLSFDLDVMQFAHFEYSAVEHRNNKIDIIHALRFPCLSARKK